MSHIIPISDDELPSKVIDRKRLIDVNKDVVTSAVYPTLCIKGRVFTLVQDDERRVLTNPNDPGSAIQAVNMAFLRINMSYRTYYKEWLTEEESEGVYPDCHSMDGKSPSPLASEKQAQSCGACKHNAWNSRIGEDAVGKGKACSEHARIAVADPRYLGKPLLLRVPPGSRKQLKDAIRTVKTRQLQYNEAVFRIRFDPEAAVPRLTFEAVGVLPDEEYAKACEMFDSEVVLSIVGLDESPSTTHAEPTPVAPPKGARNKSTPIAEPPATLAAPPPAAELPARDDNLLGDPASVVHGSDARALAMQEPIDFSPVTAAQIPAAHFARLCGADKVSAFKWLRGTQPRGLYRERVIERLKLVKCALERGTLPLPPTSRTHQFEALVRALKA